MYIYCEHLFLLGAQIKVTLTHECVRCKLDFWPLGGSKQPAASLTFYLVCSVTNVLANSNISIDLELNFHFF